MKGKVSKEEGDLLFTYIPTNQYGFILLVKSGKDTYICENHGTTEKEAELEPLIAACKTLKPKQ